MKSSKDGFDRRQLLKTASVCLATVAVPVAATAYPLPPVPPMPGFENLERAIGMVRRASMRTDLSGIVEQMQVARKAGDSQALAIGFQRLTWCITVLRRTLSPTVRRSLLRNLLLDAAANGVQLANAAAAKREIRRLTTLIA